ncbi:MAG: DUF2341 domain-containing protein, partial [Flavobacteriales bacterium]|nr:DUF2341 domain-containing protein [Flavobacteriales bacterium]
MKPLLSLILKAFSLCFLLIISSNVNAQLIGWSYVMPVTITENSGSAISNHQVLITFNSQALISAGKMKSDGSDLRFATNTTGDTLIDFWLESGINTANTKVWVKVPAVAASSTKDIYLFYGNPSATTISSPANTFIRLIANLQYSASMNENAGLTANDRSSNNITGTLMNAPSWTAGQCDSSAISYDGTNDYISCVTNSVLQFGTGDFSISIWVNGANLAVGGDNAFVDKYVSDSDYGWMLKERSGGVALLTNAGGSWEQTFGTNFIDDGAWHHVVASRSSTGNKIITIDNVQDLNYTTTARDVSSTRDLEIGRASTYNAYMEATIDEVYIYNKVLTTAEIADLYTQYTYASPALPNTTLIRKCAGPEPSFSLGAEELLSSITVADVLLCTGDSGLLLVVMDTATDLIPPYTYSWSPTTNLGCSTCDSTWASPTVTTIYQVVVTDSVGVQDSTSATVSMSSVPPVANAGTGTTMCEGNSYQLSGSGGVQYDWSPGTGLDDSTVSDPVANPVVTTSYSMIALNGCGSDTDVVVVTINPIPKLTNTDTSICPADTVLLLATGGTSYTWTPGTYLSDSTIANPVAVPLNSITYYMSSTSGAGCFNSDSVVVSVSGGAPLTAFLSVDTACLGDSVQFNATQMVCGTPMQIGFGTSSSYLYGPWMGSYQDMHTELLYTTAELTAAGLVAGYIYDIAFNVISKFSTSAYENFTVSMGNTTTSCMLAGNGWIPTSQVYGPLSYTTTTGWNVLTLSTPFFWDGTSNIVIETCYNNPNGFGPGGYDYVQYSTGFPCNYSMPYYSNVNGVDGCALGAVYDYTTRANIQFTCTGVADTGMTFTWSPTTGLSNPNIANPMGAPSMTTSYTVTGMSGGCAYIDTITLYVDTVNTLVASGDTSICYNDSVQITATGSGLYVWTPSTDLSCTNCPNPYASPTETTLYYVSSPSGCAPTDSVNVVVNGSPITASVDIDTTCLGDSVQLNGTQVTCGPPMQIGFGTSSSYLYGPWMGSYQDMHTQLLYTAAELTAAGMVAGNIYDIAFNVITKFSSSAYENFTVSVGNTGTTCLLAGTGWLPTSTVYGPVSYTTSLGWNTITFDTPFTWDGVSNIVIETCYNNPNGLSPGGYDYVQYTSGFACNNSMPYYSNVNGVDGCALAAVYDYTTRANIQFSCIGIPDTGMTYTWSPTAGLSNANIPNPKASPAFTTTYVVSGVSAGCPYSDSVTVYVDTVNSIVAGPDTSICYGDSVLLSAVGSGLYNWSPPDGLSCTNCPSPYASPTISTMYNVSSPAGCAPADSVFVAVNGSPITATVDADTMCLGDSVQLNASQIVCGIPIQVGFGTFSSTSYGPFFGSYADVHYQFLYTASELIAAGLTPGPISELSFNVLTKNSTSAYQNFQVSIGNVSVNCMVAGAGWAPTSVVWGPTNYNTYVGWNNFSFSTPFVWDGVSNIAVETCYDNPNGAGPGGNDNIEYASGFSCDATMRRYLNSAGANGCALTPSFDYTSRANIQFACLGMADTNMTYSWSPTAGLSNANVPDPAASPAITTTYVVSGVSQGCPYSDSVTIYVDTVNSMVASPDTSVCYGDSVMLTAVGSGFVWTPGADLSCTNCASPYANPTASTMYYVSSPTGCAPADSVYVTVNGSPVTATLDEDTICPNFPVQLDATQIVCDPGAPMQIGFGTSSSYLYGPWMGSYQDMHTQLLYTAAELSAAGMVAGNIYNLAFNVMNKFSTSGYQNFTISMGNTGTTCLLAGNGWLTTSAVYGPATYSTVMGWNVITFDTPFTWDGTSNIVIETCYNNPNGLGPGGYDYVQYTSGFACNNSMPYYSNVNGVDGCALGAVYDYTTRANIQFSCVGLPDTSMTYAWTPTTGLSNANIANPVATASTTTTYVVTGTSTGCSYSDSVLLTVDTSNFITVSATATDVCQGDTVILSVVGTPGMPDTSTWTYSWSPSPGLSSTTIASPNAYPLGNITYVLDVSNACGNFTDSIALTSKTAPIADAGLDTGYCVGGSVQLTATGGLTYLWSPSTGLSCTACDKTNANPSSDMTYYVLVTDSFGCTATDSVKVNVNGQPVAATSTKASVCFPGDTVQLGVNSCGGAFTDDFDPINNAQWSIIQGGFTSTNCGSVSGTALYFNGATRYAATVDINVSGGGTVDFYLKLGSGSSPCENLDASDLVSLEYSLNGGISWTVIYTYPNIGFSTFTFVSEPIPAAAQTASTRFRWNQASFSGTSYDHWAFDNVAISCSGVDTTASFTWTPTGTLSDPNIIDPIASPNGTTTYVVTANDGGCISTDSITIYIDTTVVQTSPDTGFCTGSSVL